jgi:hypothetical protein
MRTLSVSLLPNLAALCTTRDWELSEGGGSLRVEYTGGRLPMFRADWLVIPGPPKPCLSSKAKGSFDRHRKVYFFSHLIISSSFIITFRHKLCLIRSKFTCRRKLYTLWHDITGLT